jgi:rod shape-determining protein MreD
MILVLFILTITVLQTVVFARFCLWGYTPDLILVSVIIFSVLKNARYSLPLSFGLGFLEDLLSAGAFINTLSKTFFSVIIGFLKENYEEQEYPFAAVLVLIFTPLSLIFEAVWSWVIFQRNLVVVQLSIAITLTTFYNMLVFPFLYYVIQRAFYAAQK